MDKIVEIITGLGLIVTALVILITKIINGKKTIEENLPKKIMKQSNIDVGIIDYMEEVKELLNADRVQIYDYHDGEHYSNGRHAFKTSCTYEVVRTGIEPAQRLLQNIPLSCISRFNAKLMDEGFIEVKDLEEIKELMPSTYQLKTDMRIKSFYDIIICNVYGEPIGFLAVQYVKNKYHCSREEDKAAIMSLKRYVEKELAKIGTK